MDERYSHPPEEGRDGVLLADHLADVADRVQYVVPGDAATPTGGSLRDVVETLAWVHDFGKATTYFQEYLLDNQDPDRTQLRHHAPLGSFAAYYALDAQGYCSETCLAGFVAVAKHHGRLPDVAEYVVDRTHRRESFSKPNEAEKRQKAVLDQIGNIHENAQDIATSVIESATGGDGDWVSFVERFQSGALLADIEETVGTAGRSYGVDRNALSPSCYGLVLQCWSGLILADKTSAARADNSRETYSATEPSLERLDEYVRDLEASVDADRDGTRGERLNYYRSKAREDVLENAETFAESGGGVATLTLPTGMGKTLTGLSAAFSLRDHLGGKRVVYALPFTSIIDQVVEEIEEIYETDTASRLLTAHHHLSETVIRDEEDRSADSADKNDDIAGMLAESWRAGLTVTTFVQLFESLAGPGNRQSMKLPALNDSVVVLDEPQSLPLDWWKLVPRLVKMLTEQYDASVVAMTATQPQLFDNSSGEQSFDVVPELVDDPETYFEATDRVAYMLDRSAERYVSEQADPKSYDTAAAELREGIGDGESVLAVCNTVDSARTLADRVAETFPDRTVVDVAETYAEVLSGANSAEAVETTTVVERLAATDSTPILHLSTRLRPVDRLNLVQVAKEMTDRSEPLLAITTQLVEAGVDVSFDRVYRDFAPIDSIVQAAGRCNRSFERERGRVTVWWLDHPKGKGKTPAEAVYNRGTSLLPVAAETLESIRDDEGELDETAVARHAVREFYRNLHEEKDVGKQSYADFVDSTRADKLAEQSLIDQVPTADVLVCRTDADRELVNRLGMAREVYDFEELRRLLSETKPLRISVPYYREDSEIADAIRSLPELIEDEGIYHLDVRDHSSYFDRREGFVVPESTVENQFL